MSRTSSTEIINESNNPLSLTEKFIRGLEDYGFTLEAFNEANFKYHGGDTESNHKNYWKMLEGTNPFPEKTNECVCGHYIKRNFLNYLNKFISIILDIISYIRYY
jgi:hypothetical protein